MSNISMVQKKNKTKNWSQTNSETVLYIVTDVQLNFVINYTRCQWSSHVTNYLFNIDNNKECNHSSQSLFQCQTSKQSKRI